MTPLHEAIRYGGPDQVRTLLQAGADIGRSQILLSRMFRLLENIISNVPLLSEIKTKNGKTSFDLTEKSSGDGILDVIRKERKDYVEKCEKEKTESTENEDKVCRVFTGDLVGVFHSLYRDLHLIFLKNHIRFH